MSRFDTIDISPLFSENMNAKMEVAKRIRNSCLDTGFFFISQHTIDNLDKLFEKTKEFHFTMTEEEKTKIAINAYNPDNENVLVGYYKSIKKKKAVESLVCYSTYQYLLTKF
jgi:isopenicillin N synthase-like dioxygenase